VALDGPVNIHLTGCHHSCAQHYIGDIGLLACKVATSDEGDGVEGYHVLVGGGFGPDATLARDVFRDVKAEVYPYQIAFNLLPHIGSFNDGGDCSEEVKIVKETRKILGAPTLRVTATTVRVPVLRCHSEAINVELERPLNPNEARAALAAMPGVIVYDDPTKKLYPMPLDATGKDEVYIGRVREDESITNGLNLWVVSDNLRKGAALNAIQIAECLVKG
jgi:aspartate-semialdehyde dehydrogenase